MKSVFRFPAFAATMMENSAKAAIATAVPPSPMVMRLPDPTGDAPIEAIFNPLNCLPVIGSARRDSGARGSFSRDGTPPP